MNKLLNFVLATALFTTAAQADQLTGVGMESEVATGYGLYAVTMRVSESPGAISSFYLYGQSGSWQGRWHEVDIEFSPGFTGVGKMLDPDQTHSLAQGQCYSNQTKNALPTPDKCTVQAFLEGKAGAALSFNTYNHRSIDGGNDGTTYLHSNDQVFMPATHGNDIFDHYYTYYFYYLPTGIYWTLDLPPVNLTVDPPTSLPTPSFVKKDFNVVQQDATWNPAKNSAFKAFWYDLLPLAPKLASGELSKSGALMKMSMNLWDGTNTDPAHHVQDWGGEVPPKVGASSAYKFVAYYPLETAVEDVGNDPTQLTYGKAEIYSDFTTPHGKFLINHRITTFETLWHVSNGENVDPLGRLDERNLTCGDGQLTMTLSTSYGPDRRNNEPLKNCDWLNAN